MKALNFFLGTVFLLNFHETKTEGVIISPPEVVSVCSGDQLELTCTVPGTFLEWSVFLVPEGETMSRRFFRIIHSVLSATSDLEVNSITFTFLRISAEGSQPLVSRLLITPISDNLNGTEVNCTDVLASNTSSTHIKVINESTMISRNQNIEVTTISKQFGREAVTVMFTFLLTGLDSLSYSYHVSTIPQLRSQPLINYHSTMHNITVQIEVSYNIHYNVSILAASPCGKNNLTKFTQVYFANCGNPADRIDNTTVDIMGFIDPAIEGSNVTISCSSGHVWNGTAIAICGEDSEWEPDLEEISLNCLGLDSNNTQDLESRTSHETLTAAVSSSVVAFLVISALTSATGVACGYYFMRRQRRKQSSSSNQPTPLYEDVNVLPIASAVEHLEQGLELKENVAYGTAKPTDPPHHEALPSAMEHQEKDLELTENVAYRTTKPL